MFRLVSLTVVSIAVLGSSTFGATIFTVTTPEPGTQYPHGPQVQGDFSHTSLVSLERAKDVIEGICGIVFVDGPYGERADMNYWVLSLPKSILGQATSKDVALNVLVQDDPHKGFVTDIHEILHKLGIGHLPKGQYNEFGVWENNIMYPYYRSFVTLPSTYEQKLLVNMYGPPDSEPTPPTEGDFDHDTPEAYEIEPVPEPSTLLLLAIGGSALVMISRKRRR